MTLPTLYPNGYDGTTKDFLKTVCGRDGGTRIVNGSVSVTSGTTANSYVGLVPFNKGAKFQIGNSSIYCGNFGAGTTTINIGYIYNDNTTYTNDVDAWASLSTAAQSGGFVTVDETTGLTFEAEADGWLVAQLIAADADATADILFNVGVGYSG